MVTEAFQDQGQAIVADLETSGPPDGGDPLRARGPAPNGGDLSSGISLLSVNHGDEHRHP
jgi:hypothetical protein